MSERIWQTEQEKQEIIRIRRKLHSCPELSGEEFSTTEFLRTYLSGIDGMEMLSLPLKTGVAACLRGTGGGDAGDRCEIALRSDIDALAQTEKVDVPWKSRKAGVMHACGHDCHMAALLGAAMALSRLRDEFTGQIDFVFQPAEEITRGAEEMIRAGLFDAIHPKYMFGLHNWPTVPAGRIVSEIGPRMAEKINFDIIVRGRGGHGSEPQNNIDPVVCAAAVIQSLQTVLSRNLSPFDNAVLSVNSIHGGSDSNLVVDRVTMKATIRTIQPQAMKRAWDRTQQIIRATCSAYECGAEIQVEDSIPAVVNPGELYDMAHRAAVSAAGDEANVISAPPALASEDFSLYSKFVKTWFYWVGSGRPGEDNAPLHSSEFCPDESMPLLGARLFTASALFALGKG